MDVSIHPTYVIMHQYTNTLEVLHEMFTCALKMLKPSVLGRHGNMWPGCGRKPLLLTNLNVWTLCRPAVLD